MNPEVKKISTPADMILNLGSIHRICDNATHALLKALGGSADCCRPGFPVYWSPDFPRIFAETEEDLLALIFVELAEKLPIDPFILADQLVSFGRDRFAANRSWHPDFD